MNYKNAASILPASLLEQLQDYVQGGYLYIPKKEDQHKKWGDETGSRTRTSQRNQCIRKDYHSGMSIEKLSDTYFLSVHTIRKIVYGRWISWKHLKKQWISITWYSLLFWLWVVTLLSTQSVRNRNHPLCGCAVIVIQKNHLSVIMRLFKPIYNERKGDFNGQ